MGLWFVIRHFIQLSHSWLLGLAGPLPAPSHFSAPNGNQMLWRRWGEGQSPAPLPQVAHWLRWACAQNWEGSLPMAQTPSRACLAPLGWGPKLPREIELFVLGCSARLPRSSCKQPLGLGYSQNRKGMCVDRGEGLHGSGRGCWRSAGITILQLRQEGTCHVGVQGLRRRLGKGQGRDTCSHRPWDLGPIRLPL